MEPYRACHPIHTGPPSPGQPTANTVNRSPSPTQPPPLPASPSSDPQVSSPPIELVVDGVRTAILGYTWPGIEDGEPPTPKYSFFEYVDTMRNGTIEDFQKIQEQTKEWWSATLDRGAGALIHFAVDHGRLDMVKYLLDDLHVHVNHQSLNGQWTPLHRCARMIHYKHAPYFDIFELLLARGADPHLETEDGLLPFDLVVQKGYQWEEGDVRRLVQVLLGKYADVAKAEPWFYTGKSVGKVADTVISAWRSLPSLYPPEPYSGSEANRIGDRARDGVDAVEHIVEGERDVDRAEKARSKASRHRLS